MFMMEHLENTDKLMEEIRPLQSQPADISTVNIWA